MDKFFDVNKIIKREKEKSYNKALEDFVEFVLDESPLYVELNTDLDLYFYLKKKVEEYKEIITDTMITSIDGESIKSVDRVVENMEKLVKIKQILLEYEQAGTEDKLNPMLIETCFEKISDVVRG